MLSCLMGGFLINVNIFIWLNLGENLYPSTNYIDSPMNNLECVDSILEVFLHNPVGFPSSIFRSILGGSNLTSSTRN